MGDGRYWFRLGGGREDACTLTREEGPQECRRGGKGLGGKFVVVRTNPTRPAEEP